MSAAPIRTVTRPPRIPFPTRTDPESGPIPDLSTYRDAWLACGTLAHPSDRAAAESAVAELYRRAGCREPEFVWTTSPPAAQELMSTMGRADVVSISTDSLDGAPARIAHMLSASRTRMNARIAEIGRASCRERVSRLV